MFRYKIKNSSTVMVFTYKGHVFTKQWVYSQEPLDYPSSLIIEEKVSVHVAEELLKKAEPEIKDYSTWTKTEVMTEVMKKRNDLSYIDMKGKTKQELITYL